MGKTTLYHPIPLTVIRGAAEYCGWKFGAIKQLEADRELTFARYRAKIESMPQRVVNLGVFGMFMALRDCFMDDIRPHWLRQTRSGVYYVEIMVDLRPKPEAVEPAAVEQWLQEQAGQHE